MVLIRQLVRQQQKLRQRWQQRWQLIQQMKWQRIRRLVRRQQKLRQRWQHRLQPVMLNGAIHQGIGADVLTEALPPYGILRHVFDSLPPELAASVLVIPWAEFLALLPPPPQEPTP